MVVGEVEEEEEEIGKRGEGGESEEVMRLKFGGFAGSPQGGRLEQLLAEQTPEWRLPQLQSSTTIGGGFKPGQEEPWGRRRRDGRTLTIGDLGSFPLAFRRLVGVLVRCQPPSVASWLNVWSRSLVVSGVGGHWQPVGR